MKTRILFMVMALFACASTVLAQPTLDGSLLGDEAFYGTALAVQDTQTSFGDNGDPDIGVANGSELDQVFGAIDGNTLYLLIAGNIETNFNKLELFFDTTAGGQHQLRNDNADLDFNGLNRMGDDPETTEIVEGLIFDEGIEPDFYISTRAGLIGELDPVVTMYSDHAELHTSGGGPGTFLGDSVGDGDGNNLLHTASLGITIALDNSNINGVAGGTLTAVPGLADLVNTGVEMAIPLSVIGSPFNDFDISIFINGGGHDFLSNQTLGGIGGGDHLGEPRAVDFSTVAGDQFITIAHSGPNPADFNDDGDVNGLDLPVWEANFGTTTGMDRLTGDADLDGDTDGADFLVWQRQFGFTVPTTGVAAVPEPSAFALVLLGMAAVALVRRR